MAKKKPTLRMRWSPEIQSWLPERLPGTPPLSVYDMVVLGRVLSEFCDLNGCPIPAYGHIARRFEQAGMALMYPIEFR